MWNTNLAVKCRVWIGGCERSQSLAWTPSCVRFHTWFSCWVPAKVLLRMTFQINRKKGTVYQMAWIRAVCVCGVVERGVCVWILVFCSIIPGWILVSGSNDEYCSLKNIESQTIVSDCPQLKTLKMSAVHRNPAPLLLSSSVHSRACWLL